MGPVLGGILFGSVLAIMTLAGVVAATVIEDRLLPPEPIKLIKPSESSESPELPEPIKPTEQSDAPATPDNTDR
ncbi:hypothetical protein [Streptosporangium sp. NPDC049304]|uniref:hypothetical protein n=1 Tax=Streptosporangium sp. NPDC049304 TaxID=3154830 RepID=UPI003430205E